MEGIKRLSNMLEGQKDKYLIIIVKYLMLQTEMDEAFLNEEKNLKDMATYIKNKAKKEAQNNVAVIEDERVFQWAKDYFNKTNKQLGIKSKTEKKEEINEKMIQTSKFGSIFTNCNTNDIEEKKEKIEQISFFNM